jgi:hypothetical protein
MFVFRSFVGVALLSAGAEECAEESASLIQVKPQREPRRNESDELAVNLLARASGTADTTAVLDKNEKCDMERTMKTKGGQYFETGAQTSIITGNKHQFAGEDEFAVLDKINEVRRAGFSCTDPATGGVHTFKPKCRNQDLIFDCRLWFAAKLHSEDMGKRNYYAHDTQAPFPSNYTGASEPFNKRAQAYAWGVGAHKEVLMGARGAQDTPEVIVNAWLGSYGHCMALGTPDAQIAAIGRAPCTARSSGICVHSIGTFTGGLFAQRGFLSSWSQALDTSCYPATRNKENR